MNNQLVVVTLKSGCFVKTRTSHRVQKWAIKDSLERNLYHMFFTFYFLSLYVFRTRNFSYARVILPFIFCNSLKSHCSASLLRNLGQPLGRRQLSYRVVFGELSDHGSESGEISRSFIFRYLDLEGPVSR